MFAIFLATILALSIMANFWLIKAQQNQDLQDKVWGYGSQIDNLEQHNPTANMTDQNESLLQNNTAQQNKTHITLNSSLSEVIKEKSYQISLNTDVGSSNTTATFQSDDGVILKRNSDQNLVWQYASQYVEEVEGSIYVAGGNWSFLTVTVPAHVNVTIDVSAYGYSLGVVEGTLIDYHNSVFYIEGKISSVPYNWLIYPNTTNSRSYFAKAANGTICFSSSNFASVANYAFLKSEGIFVFAKGTYTLNATVDHLKPQNNTYIKFEKDAKIDVIDGWDRRFI
jgi:hypothetical protein